MQTNSLIPAANTLHFIQVSTWRRHADFIPSAAITHPKTS